MLRALVPDERLADLDKDLVKQASLEEGFDPEIRADTRTGLSLRRYLLFARWPSLLKKIGLKLEAKELLYNSYYWFLKFSKSRAAVHGHDSGIEQQAFQIIEHAPSDVDWAVIEQIEASVAREVE